MLAHGRTAVDVVKRVPTGSTTSAQQLGVHGHSISIPHEGPAKVGRAFPNVSALTGTKVLCVGCSKTWDAIRADTRSRARVEKLFTADWDAPVKWLHVLKVIRGTSN